MKKFLTILVCVLLAACCAAAAAETVEKENYTVVPVNNDFNLRGTTPDGYKSELVYNDSTALHIEFTAEDLTKPKFDVIVVFSEDFFDRERLNDLTEEEKMMLLGYGSGDAPSVDMMETAYGTQVLIMRSEDPTQDFACFISLYKGYEVGLNMFPGNESDGKLTEEQIKMAMQFLSDLDFVPMT